MILHSMGIGIKHEPTFLIDRPEGTGDDLLLIFKSEGKVWCENQWVKVNPGGFLIYKKGKHQKYGGLNKEYIDHYIHFDSMGDEVFDSLGIMTNRPGYLRNIEEMENLLRLISREKITESRFREQNIDLWLQIILRKVAQNQCADNIRKNEIRHIEEMTSLRSEIYSTPGKYSNVRMMAAAVNLSLPYFKSLYSNAFGVSCYDDLLNAKIYGGKSFLSHTDLTVREIALLCGYENDTCFMRSFKKKTGLTPSEYRFVSKNK